MSHTRKSPRFTVEEEEEKIVEIVNKGTGAGGKNTTKSGSTFEKKTSNKTRLLDSGYKYTPEGYLHKTIKDKSIVFVSQKEYKPYMIHKYGIDKKYLFREPDEAYIIENSSGEIIVKILEKKNQNVSGTVECKIWCGVPYKREYSLSLNLGCSGKINFKVCYGFCLSNFLKQKIISKIPKYEILNEILKENDITVMYGDDNYFETLDNWINK